MHISIDILREEGDMSRKLYTFALFDTHFVLSTYNEQYKTNILGNWRNKRQYDRCLSSDNSIEATEIELPQDVKDEVVNKFTAMLKVVAWAKPKKKKR